MKLAIASDLHLEFAQLMLKNPGVDALVLAGDIMVACVLDDTKTDVNSIKNRQTFTDFFDNVCNEFPHVFYVMGNHEHYHGDFRKTAALIQDFLKRNKFENVTFLDNASVQFQDFLIAGTTLWSDFNKGDPLSMLSATNGMNDYRIIEDSKNVPIIHPYSSYPGRVGLLTTKTTLTEHLFSASFIANEACTDEDKKMIVIGHHSPSYQSIHESYRLEKYSNGAYHSDLEHIMWDHDNIALWVHGHTHFPFDYWINATNVVCNPRGYLGYEASADNFQLKVIEL